MAQTGYPDRKVPARHGREKLQMFQAQGDSQAKASSWEVRGSAESAGDNCRAVLRIHHPLKTAGMTLCAGVRDLAA